MIFVTVGSQKFQFNRLLKEVDELIETGKIKDDVFAQIGVSDYKPKNYKYKEFITQEEFNDYLNKADIIITHAGTGVIVNAIKKEKKVIGVPRLSKYGEHVDDHQIQLIKEFTDMNFISAVYNTKELETKLEEIYEKNSVNYESNTQTIINDITKFIKGEN